MSVMMAAIAGQMGLNMVAKRQGLGKGLHLAADAAIYGAAYLDAKNEGRSGISGIGEMIAWNLGQAVLGTGPMLAITGGVMAAQLAPVWYQAAVQNAGVANQAYLGSFGGGFQMSDTAATMREVGVRAIQENGYNLRSVLGSEVRKYVR